LLFAFVGKRKKFEVNVLERPTENELVFEMLGVDVSFANALRRIMLSDVPTVAIEHVYMWNNSSIVHDEVLAHRLGLVPIAADPRLFDDFEADDDDPTDRNTIVFRLSVTCGKAPPKDTAMNETVQAAEGDGHTSMTGNAGLDQVAMEASALHRATNVGHADRGGVAHILETPGRPYTRHVYSRDLDWVPQGDQVERLETIRPVHEDILLAKLRPGQVLELEAHARRGTGRDHAKYSPVATASYRLMPHIEILKPIYDEDADQLTNLYEPGVFIIVPTTEGGHTRKAQVSNPYACTMSRNFMRHPVLKESIRMTRIPNHFIFQVESVGMMPPAVILTEALRVLQRKCSSVIRLADEHAMD
jgi:DNA-directed RNA polymerase I and III subunit RPAC1